MYSLLAQVERELMPMRLMTVGGGDVMAYEAQVEQLEGGSPLPEMTFDASIAHLVSLVVVGDWPTHDDRERAQQLVLRLASLSWRHG